MDRSRWLGVALALACGAGPAAGLSPTPQSAAAARAVRDPDRGLDPALRERLARVDVARDDSDAERWAAAIEARLGELAERWRADRWEPGADGAGWIAPELCVAPFFDPDSEPARELAGWRLVRAAPRATGADEEPLLAALARWRGAFRGEARLDLEVHELAGAPPRIDATVRATASGAGESARLQHAAVLDCGWRIAEGAAELVALRTASFEAVAIAPAARATFADVAGTLFEDPELYRARLAPGLDHWRRRIASSLEPGALGHHGVALGDVDGDGLEDVYLCRPGGLPNQLLLHTKEHRLRDASAEAGVDLLDFSSSALWVDLDGDADLDLVVATGAGLAFLANDGTGRFAQELLVERSLATSLAAADFDLDGDIDLYVCSYLSPYERNGLPVPYHDAQNGEANALLRNDTRDGQWRFVDATAASGLDENNRRFSFAAAWEDFDADGDPDLFVSNDFGRNNLYRNEGGRFRDVAAELGAEILAAGMGIDWGDFDGDGWSDAYATNMCTAAGSRLTSRPDFRAGTPEASRAAFRHHARGNTLLRNAGGRAFEDVTAASGTAFGRWGWGAIFVDLDGDGALDLFAPNGFATGERGPDLDSFFWRRVVLRSPDAPGAAGEEYAGGWRAINRLLRQGYSWNGRERNVALWNAGGGRFADVSAALGLDQPDDSRAAARVDWEGDGDEDLVLTNRNAPMLRVLENRRSGANAWIAFELRSSDPHRTAIGARVTVRTNDRRNLVRTLRCGSGYLAQSSARLTFGLGAASVERVEVRWPGREREDFGAPPPRAAYALVEGSGEARALAAPAARAPAPEPARALEPASDAGAARTVLPEPLPLPRLSLETWDGKPAALLGIALSGPQGTGEPLLLFLWSADDPSKAELARLAAAADALRGAGLRQILALSVDAAADARERALGAWQQSAWPFARGFVGEESLQVLELVLGALHDDARGLALPAAFLVDPAGRLVSTYEGALDPERLRADLALCDAAPDARLAASVPFAGRWLVRPSAALDRAVAARLAEHGLERPAGEYDLLRVEVRRSSAAGVEYEIGLARERQGRLADAIEHFRRALAADPSHAAAARALAFALHQSGERPAALRAYREALALDPADATTRYNLGLLHLALGDRTLAERELAALRQLESELAAELEARIAELDRR